MEGGLLLFLNLDSDSSPYFPTYKINFEIHKKLVITKFYFRNERFAVNDLWKAFDGKGFSKIHKRLSFRNTKMTKICISSVISVKSELAI